MSDNVKKEKRIQTYHLYLNSFLAWASNGKFILEENIAAIGIKTIADRILTRRKVTKIWHVTQFPYDFDYDLIEKLKIDMRERYPDVQMVFQLINDPIYLNTENRLFLDRRKAAASQYTRMKSFYNSLDETDKAVGIKLPLGTGMNLSFSKDDVTRVKQVWDSYVLSTEHAQSGKSIYYTHLFIHAHAPNNKTMNKFMNAFRTELLSLQLQFRSVKSLLNNYLENYGPAGFISSNVIKRSQLYLPRENITQILPTKSEGMLNTEGVLLGVNLNNGFPFLLEFFKSGQGQTVMIGAKTGWGKTHLGFGFVIGLLADNVHVSVTDLKGNEWNKIGDYVNYKEISLGGSTPCSVNTLRLDDMEVTSEDCVYVYNTAIAATVRVLSLMSEVSNHEYKGDLEKALEIAVITLYNKHKIVKTNPDTFSYSKHLKYEDVLPCLAEIESNESLPEEVRKVCNLARYRCESVLKGSSNLAESFKNEISVQEIINVPLVIYSLNKNTDHDLTVAETISIFMVEYLSTKKHHYRKRKGLHSALVAEEVQRYQDTGEIVQFLSSQTTGSRSQNVMIIFMLNSLDRLNGPSFAPIKSNVSTAILGLLSEGDIEMVRDSFGFRDITDNLTLINNNPQIYKNAFAVSFNTGYQYGNTLIKAMLPKHMNESLATRTIRQE